MTLALTIALALALLLPYLRRRLWSFQAQSPADLAKSGPKFDLRTHLSGPLMCEGLIYGPTGRVTSRFVAHMTGEWHGNTGTLRERFHYDSGTVQDRVWTLHLAPDGTIRAEAPDVVGAGSGQASGAAVLMNYRIKLTPEAGGHVLAVTDWMYLMENGTIMNRSQFSKFGFTVAELVATIRKAPAEGTMA
jgi:Protein of unknown function (DUF3833)